VQPDFHTCEAKLARAHVHRRTLAAEIETFFSSESFGYRVSFDEQQSAFLVHALVPHDQTYRWGTVIGDVVHNLRSALDYLIHQLVLLEGQSPRKEHQFPICDNLERYEHECERGRLDGIAEGATQRIRDVQPFAWAKRSNAPARLHALAQLRDLSNRDKHQMLLPVQLLPREFEWLHEMDGAEPVDTWTTDESIGHGGLLMSIRVRQTEPVPTWEPRLRLGGFLALHASGLPAHDKPVLDLLEILESAVRQVLDLFRDDFGGRKHSLAGRTA
jgi:hypothetical protein